jgi:hypothetical protein
MILPVRLAVMKQFLVVSGSVRAIRLLSPAFNAIARRL